MRNSVCLDASFIVRMLVGPEPLAQQAESLWATWVHQGRMLVAPALLYFEVSNALFRYVKAGKLPFTLVRNLLDAALDLGIRLYSDPDLHREALALAHELRLPAAYDAHYLALARRLNAEFWTADRRLAQAVAGRFSWVHTLP